MYSVFLLLFLCIECSLVLRPGNEASIGLCPRVSELEKFCVQEIACYLILFNGHTSSL